MGIDFAHPSLALLALPLVAVLLRWRNGRWPIDALRFAAAALALLALVGPSLRVGDESRDLVVLVDRSDSMPAQAREDALEFVRLVEAAKGARQRLVVLSFGAEPTIEHLPKGDERFADFQRELDQGGSDLARALGLALELVPRDRPARLVVLSDGEWSGADPLEAARAARARGIEIAARPVQRAGGADLAAARMELPAELAEGEPFQFRVWVRAGAAKEASWRLQVDGETKAEGRRAFEEGWNQLQLRLVLARTGVAQLRFELLDAADPVPENDVLLGAVRVRGATRVLVLNEAGQTSALARALASGGIAVETALPEDRRLDQLELERFDGVVLENVSAARVGAQGTVALARYVLDRGRGLLMTGGRASFARGGWWRSPLDPALVVELDPRNEDRRTSVALALALDRSGSMAAPVGLGTKMDLANDGAARAIELLSPGDAVTLIAVDTSARVVLPLTLAEDPSRLAAEARRVTSSGGGIYVHTALRAMVRELETASQANRHLVLFADAADAEEQEGCLELARELAGAGAVLSVIALGTQADSDGAFLVALARAGGGQSWFTESAADLPALFAEEVASATRGGLVEERTAVLAAPGLVELGASAEGFGAVGGFHLARRREPAQVALELGDEKRSPLLVFGRRGLGRSAAYLGQVGGTLGQDLVEWPGFAPLASSVLRWLTGELPPSDVHARAALVEGDFEVEVELGADAARRIGEPSLAARVVSSGGTKDLTLERVHGGLFRGRMRLPELGVHLGRVVLPDGTGLDLAPVAVSSSPEFRAELDPERGRRVLERLGEATGAAPVGNVEDLWLGPLGGARRLSLVPWLVLAALLVFVFEVAARRLDLFPKRRRVASFAGSTAPEGKAAGTADKDVSGAPDAPAEGGAAGGTGSLLQALRQAREQRQERP